jgi:amino acid transporter
MADREQSKPPQQKVTAFARESTGLVKNVSLIDSISLNLSNMSIGPLLTTIAGSTSATLFIVSLTSPSLLSGLNLVSASIIAFLLSVPQIVVYTMMSRRFPRTGGDYIWITRSFGGFFGSTLSFFGYTMETLAFLALVAVLVDFAVGSVGLTMCFSYGVNATCSWGALFSNSTDQFLVGAIPFAAVILLNIWKPKAGYRLVTVMTLFGIFALLLAIGALLFAGRAGVEGYVNSVGPTLVPFGGSNSTYSSLANSYKPSGLAFDTNISHVIYIMPVMFAFVYPWLNAAPAVGSELKGNKTRNWNVPISAVISFTLLTTTLAVLYYVAGMPFVNEAFASPAWTYAGLNFFTLSMSVAGNMYIAWVIGIGLIVMQFGTIAYGVIVFSRYLLAQSFDRFLPSRLSYVSPRYSSPVMAHIVDLVIAVGLIGLATFFYQSFSALFSAIIASMIYFVFIGLAAAAYAFRKERGGSRILLGVAGILSAGVFAFISYQYLTSPTFAFFNTLNETYLIGTLVGGAVIYLISKQYHKAKGIDISLNYKEIPPE